MIADSTPLYNLKAVLKETGIKADVLRAWERRYGMPLPQRTAGGHRLYSHRDIETIRWLMARQEEGLSISRAVELWKELETDSGDPLAESHQGEVAPAMALTTTSLMSTASLDQIRQQWLQACLSFNEPQAESVLNQAFSMYPPEMVVSDVLQRGLHDIGEMWYQNKATVQQEHFASALAMRRVDTLLSGTPMPTFAHSIIVACPPDEWHTFTPLTLSLFLRRRGWNVVYLGANNPNERLLETVQSIQPRLIILSSQQLPTAATLMQTAAVLTEKGVTVAFGGRIFNVLPELRQRVHGHFLGENIDAAMLTVEGLLRNPRPIPHVEPVAQEYIQACALFKEKRGLIELDVIEYYRARGIPTDYLGVANEFFGNALIGAFSLGGLDYINADLDWLRTLLTQHDLSPELVYPFMQAYAQVMKKHMGKYADIIVFWLEQQTYAKEFEY